MDDGHPARQRASREERVKAPAPDSRGPDGGAQMKTALKMSAEEDHENCSNHAEFCYGRGGKKQN